MLRNKPDDLWSILSEMLQDGASSRYLLRDQNVRTMFRATVLAVDTKGGMLENESGSGAVSHLIDGKTVQFDANLGPKNPRNSIKARIITGEFDQFLSDEELRIYWPLMSEHDYTPIKPGEHVYVVFEDEDFEHGLWLGKVPGHEDLNYYRGETSFKTKEDDTLSALYGDSPQEDTSQEKTDIIAAGRYALDRLKKLF